MDLEQKVIEEIKEWANQVLDKPNSFFNNLPACPYARKAFLSDKVGFSFSYEKSMHHLYTVLSQFDDTYDVILCVQFDFVSESQEFHDYIGALNDAIATGTFVQKDLWVMGFHPYDEGEEAFDQEFDYLVDEPYAMFFVQRLSTIEKSAEMLREKGYYDQYLNDPETAGLWDERQELYRRLCDAGNEKWYGQEKSQAC
tara:strand:+ start:7437 stop:8030 length:594 start_codon:yes stop_codon:yes gene_type:complete